jgi:hypothetical protein
MKRLSLRLLALALITAGAAVGRAGDDETLKEITGYRQWTRVTEKVVQVENLSIGG